MNYFINEGNRIGGQEPQALGVNVKLTTASVAVTKGQLIEVTGDWTVGPASDGSTKVCGIAANDASVGGKVVIETEGFVKLTGSVSITAGQQVLSAGSGKVKPVSGSPTVAEALAKCGVVIAGCNADGLAYIKFTL